MNLGFTKQKFQTYFLPAVSKAFYKICCWAKALQDNEEHRRLDLQHQIYTAILGGHYPAAPFVRYALRPRPHRRPSVFDVGTGSGRWSVFP